jgi:GT2 family glycosyltransferase
MTAKSSQAHDPVPKSVSPADVSVVICAYDSARLPDLEVAIGSLHAQTTPPGEIVVAIDRNPDLLARVLDRFPGLVVVPNSFHPGAGGARNAGVAASSGSVLAFIDDDVAAERDWLEQLLPAFDDEAVLGVGGGIDPAWATHRPAWFPEEFDWVIGCTYRGLPEAPAKVRNLISANMAVRRDVFDSLGGFLEDFGKRGAASEPEETEFCLRAAERWPERSWRYVPAARVRHRVTHDRETLRYFIARCRNEGKGKARMVKRAAAVSDGLESERRYVVHVLPTGVIKGIADGLRGDLHGFGRAGAILTGFLVTALTYISSSILDRAS